MNQLQIELDNDTSTTNQERFIASKHELEQIEKYETHGHILRTKCTWIEDGSKHHSLHIECVNKSYVE